MGMGLDMSEHPVFGLFLIVIGLDYLVKPTLFRRWFWMRTSIAIRLLSEKNYIIYMRVLGVIFIVVGEFLITTYLDKHHFIKLS